MVLPREIFAAAGWTEDTPLQAEVSADGAVTLRPAPEQRAEAAEYLRRHWRALQTSSRAFLAHRRREAKRERRLFSDTVPLRP